MTVFLALFLAGCSEESLESISPDGKNTVRIYENAGGLDRNFELYVNGSQVFYSPDEGQAGTERVIWSADSKSFLLVGKNFLRLEQPPTLPGEEAVYLLCDLDPPKVYCESTQQDRHSSIPVERLENWSPTLEGLNLPSQSRKETGTP